MARDESGSICANDHRRLADALEHHQHIEGADIGPYRACRLSPAQQLVEHAITSRGPHGSRGWRERHRRRLEQRAVELLTAGELVEEVEQRRLRVGACRATRGRGRDLTHPLDDDRGDQMLLGGEVPKQRAAADAGALGDLGDADVEAPLAEQLRGGLEQAPPVALGVGRRWRSPRRTSLPTFSYAATGLGRSVEIRCPDVAPAQRERHDQRAATPSMIAAAANATW